MSLSCFFPLPHIYHQSEDFNYYHQCSWSVLTRMTKPKLIFLKVNCQVTKSILSNMPCVYIVFHLLSKFSVHFEIRKFNMKSVKEGFYRTSCIFDRTSEFSVHSSRALKKWISSNWWYPVSGQHPFLPVKTRPSYPPTLFTESWGWFWKR